MSRQQSRGRQRDSQTRCTDSWILGLVDLGASFGTLRDHCTGNPTSEAMFDHLATWHGHVRAVWAYLDVCNDLDHNVVDKGRGSHSISSEYIELLMELFCLEL